MGPLVFLETSSVFNRSRSEVKQTQITFDSKLKSALLLRWKTSTMFFRMSNKQLTKVLHGNGPREQKTSVSTIHCACKFAITVAYNQV